MSKHESRSGVSLDILRPWRDIDPKVIVGAASSVTVGAVITAGAAVGIDVPVPVAVGIVIAVYAVAAYWTKTRIPVADDAGLTAQQTVVAGRVIAAADELADDDFMEAAEQALRASADALDRPGDDHPAT